MRAAGVGCFGKAWSDLREALRTAGVDLKCPAAVAAEQGETLTEALSERLLTYTEAAREKGAHPQMSNNAMYEAQLKYFSLQGIVNISR